ncbi:probable serine/threonine-protein kinase kinX [Lingula anatina]|uniref:Probable serine/threonine-protein kinase kinX n=1 Tax=Lingula anatina TaxID=7574 RepID=A0A1S3HTG2_LINAN|nr:probable serine/threonine-protein kinase kinX [Lingula anatina]|eukprot:XP_013389308.1 probable serine/threonine-protein kinase kinX [Lingula anatina]
MTDCVWKVKEGFARACHNGMHLGNKITTYLYQGLDVEATKALLYSVLKKAAYKVHDVYVRLPRFNGDPIHDGLVVVAWVVCAIAQGLVVYWARRKISLDNNVRKARQMRLRFSHPISSEDYYDRITRLIREQEEEEDAEGGGAELPDETESLQNENVTSAVTDNDDKDGANPVDDLGNDSGVWADMSLGRIEEEEEEEEVAPTVSSPSLAQEEPKEVKEAQIHLPPEPEDNAQLLDLKDESALESVEVQPDDTHDEEQNTSGTTDGEELESSTDAPKDSAGEMQKLASSAVVQEPQGEPVPDAASQMDMNNNETENDGSEHLIEEIKESLPSNVSDVNTDETRGKTVISETLNQTDRRDLPTPQPTEANRGGGGWWSRIGHAAWVVFRYILEHPELF